MAAKPPLNFHMILEGKLAGCALPDRSQLEWLREHGFRAILSLHPIEEPPVRMGFIHRFSEVANFKAPGMDQLAEICEFIDYAMLTDQPIVIHCRAGLGRTGAILAAFMVYKGASATESIAKIRQFDERYIDNEEQEHCVREFEEYLRTGEERIPREPERFQLRRKEMGLSIEEVKEYTSHLAEKPVGEIDWRDIIRAEKRLFANQRFWCSECKTDWFAAPNKHAEHRVMRASIQQQYLGKGLVLERGIWDLGEEYSTILFVSGYRQAAYTTHNSDGRWDAWLYNPSWRLGSFKTREEAEQNMIQASRELVQS